MRLAVAKMLARGREGASASSENRFQMRLAAAPGFLVGQRQSAQLVGPVDFALVLL
jgi:hypothetical protein